MRLDNFILFLGLGPNRVISREFIRFGGLRVNDCTIVNYNYSLNTNDIFQVNLIARNYLSNLYGARFNQYSLEYKSKFVQFLHVN